MERMERRKEGGKEGRKEEARGLGREGASLPLRLSGRVELVVGVRGSSIGGLQSRMERGEEGAGERGKARRKEAREGGKEGSDGTRKREQRPSVSLALESRREDSRLTLIPARRSRDMVERGGETERGRGKGRKGGRTRRTRGGQFGALRGSELRKAVRFRLGNLTTRR